MSDAADTPGAEESPAHPVSGPRSSRRLPTLATLAVLSFVTVVDLLLLAAGLVGGQSFVYLGVAALLGIGACGLWEIVELRHRQGPTGTSLAWFAFPFALLLAFAQIPFLAMSVYPPLAETLGTGGRLETFVREMPDGTFLEICFPEPMQQRGNMLRLDGTLVPPSYFDSHPEHFRWLGARTLSIAIDRVSQDLDIGEIHDVAINSDLHVLRHPEQGKGVQLFRTTGGERLSGQSSRVR